MADDLIPMGDTAAPDSGGGGESAPEPSDGGLSGLSRALGDGEQQQPSAQPAQPSRPAPARPDRRETYAKGQRTWKSRQEEKNRQLQELREERESWKSHLAGMVQQVQEYVAAVKGVPKAEEAPDPMLYPVEFQAWLSKQQDANLDAKLAPALEQLKLITGRIEETDQQHQHAAEQQRLQQQTEQMLQGEFQEYAQTYPELAYGAEDRITSGLETLTRVFEQNLGWDQDGATMAGRVVFAISEYARKGGENGAAAVDAFFTGLIQDVAAGLQEHYSAMGYDLPDFGPVYPDGSTAPAYQAPPPPPSPAAREQQRLEQVRARAGSVSSARPRQPARNNGNQPKSKAEALAAQYRRAGREVDWNAVNRLAKEEAGGNLTLALKIMQSIPAA